MKRTSLRMDGLQISCTVYSNHNTATYNLWLKKKKSTTDQKAHTIILQYLIFCIFYLMAAKRKRKKKKLQKEFYIFLDYENL